jgi:DNA topoisomerase VI subunit A
MKEWFDDKKFRPDSLALIEWSNEIISEYVSDGYTLTLRQLYYQLVSRDVIPNQQKEYNRLGALPRM